MIFHAMEANGLAFDPILIWFHNTNEGPWKRLNPGNGIKILLGVPGAG
jgi:hypothetical protein